MAAGTPVTRIYFKYPVFGETTLDVQDTLATVLALTAVAAPATITARMITVTRASDGIAAAHYISVDNIAGLQDLTLVHDQP